MSELLANALSFWGTALASASLAALVVVPAAAAVEAIWKSMPSSWRSWMWRLVFVKIVGVAIFPYAIELPVLPAPAEVVHSSSKDVAGSSSESQGTLEGNQSVGSTSQARAARLWQWSRALPVLFGLWFLGAVANLAVALLRGSRGEQSRRRTTYVVDGPAFSALEALYQRFGLKKRPDLIATSHEGSPFVADWVRPALYCPSAWLSTCSASDMQLAFAHELAHLARRDLVWNRFVAGCQAILFFHPAIWLAAWRYRTAQEIACDEMALARTGGSPCDLARLLVGFVEQDSARFYGVAAMTGASVTIRERVLAMQRTIGSKSPGMWATALAVVAAILVLTPWTLAQEKAKVKRKKKNQTTQQPGGQQTESSGASASASAGGSASGGISGAGSASITVQGSGAADGEQGNGQQSAGTNKKVDVSESSSTTTINGKTTTKINRTISVVDDDHEVKIAETNDDVRVLIVDRKTGEEKTYVAKNVKELQEKYAEAYEAYLKSMPRKKPGKTSASAMVEEKELKLRKQAKPSAANRIMKRQLEQMMRNPEVKGTEMEKMIREMRRLIIKERAAGEADADEADVEDEGEEATEAESGEEEDELDEEEGGEESAAIGISERIETAMP